MSPDQEALLRSRLRWLLAGVTALVYWRVSQNGFLNYDDARFVVLNPHVYTGLSLANLKWAFTTLNGGVTSYQPLVWISHQLDCQLFGLKAGAQHLTNVWFHAVNAVLLFTLLDKLTAKPWRSAMVAALFALHPLHVGTVAWIVERKTLVCTFFWLLTTLAYLRYVRRGGWRNYVLVLVLCAAALLSKPIAVSLPFTLLLLDFWPLGRYAPSRRGSRTAVPNASGGASEAPSECGASFWSAAVLCRFLTEPPGSPGTLRHGRSNAKAAEDCRAPKPGGGSSGRLASGARPVSAGRLLLEKAPLFGLSGLACWITLLAQADMGAVKSLHQVPMGARLENSVVACLLYLWKTVRPAGLAPIYILRQNWAWWQVAGAALLLGLISVWAVRQARRRPWVLFGWCWYLVTLGPTLGLVQVGSQGMADRYTYVPLIGIFILAVWEVLERAGALKRAKPALGAASLGAIGACAVLTVVNTGYWRNSISLFEHAIRVTDRNYIAYQALGMAFANKGNLQEASANYRESLTIKPDQPITLTCLGEVLLRGGDSQGAFNEYSAALDAAPQDAEAHRRLAQLFMNSPDPRFHDSARALAQARLACKLSKYRDREMVAVLAQAYAANHRTHEALQEARKVLALSVGPRERQGALGLAASIRRVAIAWRPQKERAKTQQKGPETTTTEASFSSFPSVGRRDK